MTPAAPVAPVLLLDGRHQPWKARAGLAAIALPPTLVARALGRAWLIALAVHAVAFGALGFLLSQSRIGEEPPVRLVFVEPPPPPPAPLGAPAGLGSAPAVPDPAVENPRGRPAEPEKALRSAPKRLRRLDARAKPKPAEQPDPATPPAPAPEPAAGLPSGSAAGESGGLVGGVEGGLAGGVVGGAGSGPVPVGRVAHPPALVHRISPVYPEAARRRDVAGLVLLEAVLDREGRVEPGIRILRSVPLLDEEAIAAVRRWRFRPARDREGRALRVILEVPIRFVLR